MGGFTGRPVVQRDTVGDTVVVRTVSGSVWGAARALVPEVSIGKASGDSTYLFGRIGALAVAPDGTIYVLDGQRMEIRAYGPDGEYRETIGRRGVGPGELESPDGMVVLADGRILVHDPGNGRIQVYAPDGSPLAEWQVVPPTDYFSDPLLYDEHDHVDLEVLRHDPTDFMRWHTEFLRLGPDGSVVDTVRLPQSGFRKPTIEVRAGGATSAATLPFSPSELWAFEPAGYFVHAISTHYRIDLLRTNAPVLRIERAWTPVPVTPNEKAGAEAGITRMARHISPGWHWTGPAVPDRRPPFTHIAVGREGRIWVQVSVPPEEEENPAYDPGKPDSRRTLSVEPTRFDVFEPDGTYFGRVRAPSDFSPRPTVFDGDHVWAVTRDSLGVERVVRYRIAADGTGANAS